MKSLVISALVLVLSFVFGTNWQPAPTDALWSNTYTFQDAMVDLGVISPRQHEAILRVREGEMAAMLMQTNLVDTAAVTLSTLPAMAVVSVSGTCTLTPEDGETIALTVSRMMEGLLPENVMVVDDNLNVLFVDD